MYAKFKIIDKSREITFKELEYTVYSFNTISNFIPTFSNKQRETIKSPRRRSVSNPASYMQTRDKVKHVENTQKEIF